jgi:hypothetical protein
MIDKYKTDLDESIEQELNDICEECQNKDKSVSQNLLLLGYKICKSCRISKTIFPV